MARIARTDGALALSEDSIRAKMSAPSDGGLLRPAQRAIPTRRREERRSPAIAAPQAFEPTAAARRVVAPAPQILTRPEAGMAPASPRAGVRAATPTSAASGRSGTAALERAPGFSELIDADQVAMRQILRTNNNDADVRNSLTTLAGSAAFRGLGQETRRVVLQELSGAMTDGIRRNAVSGLCQAPGFGRLDAREQQRQLRLVGTDSMPISVRRSGAMCNLLASSAFTSADAAGQAAQLRQFASNDTGAVDVMQPPDSSYINGLQRVQPNISAPTNVRPNELYSHSPAGQLYTLTFPDNGQTVRVVVPPSEAPGLHQHNVADVANGLSVMDPALRASVRTVLLNSREFAGNDDLRRRSGDPSACAHMTAGADGLLTVYPTTDGPGWEGLAAQMVHEVGHFTSFARWRDPRGWFTSQWEPWRAAMRSDGVRASRYAHTDDAEDFAEAFQLYIQVRRRPEEAQVRALFPRRFALLDEFWRYVQVHPGEARR